jgi:hypothetical protein
MSPKGIKFQHRQVRLVGRAKRPANVIGAAGQQSSFRDDRSRSEADAPIGVCCGSRFSAAAGTVFAAAEQVVTVHLDPNCGCCSGWVTPAASGLSHQRPGNQRHRCGEEEARRSRRSCRLPYGGSLSLCCGRTCSSRRAQALPGRETERDRPCRSRHADRFARHGRRQAGTV